MSATMMKRGHCKCLTKRVYACTRDDAGEMKRDEGVTWLSLACLAV